MSSALPQLISFVLRRDRLRILAWTLTLSALVALTASAWNSLYPTLQSREQFAAALNSTPAVTAVLGPLHDPTTVGGLTAWRLSSILTLVLGIVSIFLVVRHTRGEETTGRAELLLSGGLNRRSLPVAALIPSVTTLTGFGLVSWVVLAAFSQSLVSSFAFMATVVGGALFFTALALLAAGIFPTTRGASGASTLVAGLMFIIFVVSSADVDLTWLDRVTPFGWASRAEVFAGEQWWWVVLPFFLSLLIVVVAITMAALRDVGSALVRPRQGRSTAARRLTSPLTLAWRVDRSLIVVWLCAMTALGVVVGILTTSAARLLESSSQLQQLVQRLGSSENFTDAYASALIGFLSLATTALTISLLLRTTQDESAGRLELILSGDVTRGRLLSARLIVAGFAVLAIQSAYGVALGLAYSMSSTAGWDPVFRYLGVALLNIPAIALMAAVTFFVAAALPRIPWLPWAAFAYIVAVGELGPLLNLPTWAEATTPFWFIPRWPIEDLSVEPLVGLLAISAVVCLVGFAGLRRRNTPA